jgi:hypothetical protein
MECFGRRMFGEVPDPLRATGHHMGVTIGYGLFELQIKRWRRTDRTLRDLAVMATAVALGCRYNRLFAAWVCRMGVPHGCAAWVCRMGVTRMDVIPV